MPPDGAADAVFYMLGEGPGADEDKQNKPFVGVSGKLLRKQVRIGGWYESVTYNNVVRTRPPGNRNPTYEEIECCRPSVIEDIEMVQPKVIVGLGNIALSWVTGFEGITKWQGKLFPVQVGSHRCWFYPMQHPAAILRKRKGKKKDVKSEDELHWERKLKWIFNNVEVLGEPTIEEPEDYFKGVRWVTGERGYKDIEEIEKWFKYFSESPYVAIDYETANDEDSKHKFRRVRPYGMRARILTVSISDGEFTCGFPIDHKDGWNTFAQVEAAEELFFKFLMENGSRKIAHNAAFEMEWTGYVFGKSCLREIQWEDTAAQAYCLGFNREMLALDVLTLAHFGFQLKEVSQLDRNQLDTYPVEEVVKYNCLDAKYTCRLFEVQRTILENSQLVGVYQEQVRRISTLVLTQLLGLEVDFNVVKHFQDHLSDKLASIEDEIAELDVVKRFVESNKRPFKIASAPDVGLLLSKFLKVDIKTTARGNISTDQSVLEELDHPVAKLILEYRELAKLKSTYVDTLAEDGKFIWPDGKVHPILNSMITQTRRLSSDSPNEQNFPKRQNKEIRSQIVASSGCYFVACDYGQIEFRVIGMCSRDPILCDIIKDKYDVHKEWAERIVHEYPSVVGGKKFLNDKDVMGNMRQSAKNSFVFPICYGAAAPTISEYLKVPIKNVENLMDDFWDNFPGILEWQKELVKNYEETGFVELLSGFRCHGPLSRNQIINYPVQGTACDIVVDGMNRISEIASSKKQWHLQPRLNVHDDLSFYLPENKIDDALDLIVKTMLDCKFDFVNVPLSVEVSIGTDWYNLQEEYTVFSDEL